MPILWRYLIKNFLNVFLLCVSAFITILLIVRFQVIARFAALGTGLGKTTLFILLRIPEILPIALPISALISSLLLMQRLSEANVISMIRSSALSLNQILFPLKVCGFFLALFCLIFTTQLSPYCRRESKLFLIESTMNNPLLLLRKNRLIKAKDSYIEMDMVRSGEKALNLLFAFKNPSTGRINLITAKKLKMDKGGMLNASCLSMISHFPSKTAGFDHLMLEHQTHLKTDITAFTQLTSEKPKHLTFSESHMGHIIKHACKGSKKALGEIAKRLSFPFAVYGFTFLGASFGIQIARGRSLRGQLIVILLCVFTFSSFLIGRSLHKSSILSILLFILPHPVLYFAARYNLKRISKGII